MNQRRLAEKGLSEMEQAVTLLSRTLQRHELVTDEGKAILEVVSRYAKSWSLLLQYDEDRLELPKDRHGAGKSLDYHQAQTAITALHSDLSDRGEATDLFGREREHALQSILGNLDQTFGGQDFTPASRKKQPISSTSSSRTTPSATATSASARSSSCSSCGKTTCSTGPASTTTAWSPWPC